MKIYARIENGRVVEIIDPMVYEIDAPKFMSVPINADDPESGMSTQPADWPTFKAGDEVPIGRRFHPEVVATLVDVTGVVGFNVGDSYVNGVFAPYVPPAPTAAETLSGNTAMRDTLLATASARIAPLQDAVDLDEATAEEIAALKLWKQYRVAVNRVNLSLVTPPWPAQPA